jgi:primosomal protein N' (replication factor Y) (superfamily II helicase)
VTGKVPVLGHPPVPDARDRRATPGPPESARDGPVLHRAVVRVPRVAGARLSRALTQMQSARSAKKLPPIRVQVDPVSLG